MYDKPKYQEFNVEGIQHVDPKEAWEMLKADDAVLLDIRENFEMSHQKLNVPDEKLLHIPMMTMMDHLEEIPADKKVFVLCAIGERSAKITNLLKFQGHSNAFNLDGGLKACRDNGLPFTVDRASDCGHSDCDCSSCGSDCC